MDDHVPGSVFLYFWDVRRKTRVPTVMENPEIWNHPGKSRKNRGFLSFFKKSWKTDISRKKSWKSHGILHKPSVLCTMYGYGSLVVCIYKFTTFFHALSWMYNYINVCLVMVVAVRAGHLDFSKKFKIMVIDFNFIQSIQLYRPNLWLYPTLIENSHGKS